MSPLQPNLRPAHRGTSRSVPGFRRRRPRWPWFILGGAAAVLGLTAALDALGLGILLVIVFGIIGGACWGVFRGSEWLGGWSSDVALDPSTPTWRAVFAAVVGWIAGGVTMVPMMLMLQEQWRWLVVAGWLLLSGSHVRTILQARERMRRRYEEIELDRAAAARRR